MLRLVHKPQADGEEKKEEGMNVDMNVERIDVCWRCAELRAAVYLSAEEYIRFTCDLPPVSHSCGRE